MSRVGVIGCGAIGRPVARTILRGEAGSRALARVLARFVRELDGFPVTADGAAFLAEHHDLVIEAGGPDAFRALVPAALERSEVWAVPWPKARWKFGCRSMSKRSGSGKCAGSRLAAASTARTSWPSLIVGTFATRTAPVTSSNSTGR
jgi:Homoserine dehydrogenase, NAD binding domain